MLELLRYDYSIYALDAAYIRPQLAAIHFIVENDQVAIVDTASYTSLPRVLDALQSLKLTPANVAYVFLTHIHLDHAGGAGVMMQAFPEARLVVHPRGAAHMADPTKLFAAVGAVYGPEAARRLYGDPTPVAAERIIAASDGDTLDLAGRTLTCLDTPGHARHHLCLRDTRSGGIFTGDIFGMSFRELDVEGRPSVVPTTSPTQFDPPVMHASVDRILSYQPEAVFMTHFARVSDVQRLGADLHRLIDAHVAVAERERDSGPEREARIVEGLWALMDAEAARQGWRLAPEQWREVLRSDIEINAQGLHYWLDHAAPTS
ncbi:MAG: MBL fold metallo-hydrolase [Candidatus Competibacteraceae bacterium]|nr:MBL fold metallo-hydrolase [Candidatus Competibacteraceae bacterium]